MGLLCINQLVVRLDQIRLLTSCAWRPCSKRVPSLCRRCWMVTCYLSSLVANDTDRCTLILGLKTVGITATATVRERQTFAHCSVVIPSAKAAATRTYFRLKSTSTVYSYVANRTAYWHHHGSRYFSCTVKLTWAHTATRTEQQHRRQQY